MEPVSSTEKSDGSRMIASSTGGVPLREFQKRIGRFLYKSEPELKLDTLLDMQNFLKLIKQDNIYSIPSYDDLYGWILRELLEEMQLHLGNIKNSWESTGCSLLLDGWKDFKGRKLINVLVACPMGTVYLGSADISDSDDAQEYFEKVLADVGVKNVVQIISNFTSPRIEEVGQKLVDKYKTFFWTISGSCCIELMLEKFGKMVLVEDTLNKAKTITSFVHGHKSVRELLRNQTSLCKLVKPSRIRSIFPFLTLQHMVNKKATLEKFFLSSVWNTFSWASTVRGKLVAELVADHTFWEGANLVLKAVLPLVNVLELMKLGNEELHLGNIYETINQAKEMIKEQFKDTISDYMPFWEAIEDIWYQKMLNPLYAAGYFLNPHLFYRNDRTREEILSGLFRCISRMTEDPRTRNEIFKKIDEYQKASGAVGLGIANLQSNTSPVNWWLEYGKECPELQQFAIRVLSQTGSDASKYQLQRNMAEKQIDLEWYPMFEEEQTDPAFLHYNLHLVDFKPDVSDIWLFEMRGIDDWIFDNSQAVGSSSGESTCMESKNSESLGNPN